MRKLTGSLQGRLLLSHVGVVIIGVAVLLVAGRRLGSVFVSDHLRSMGGMMGGLAPADSSLLEDGINVAFNRALLWAAAVSSLAAMMAAAFSARRMLKPLGEVRRVARRLASGSYSERVPIPAESELAALAADVNALAQALQDTEQRRLQLIGEVAHELRTPVATLKGYLEGLLDGVFEPDPETLTASIREARRMERLASDLSRLSRTEEGRVDLHIESTDLAALTAEVAERLRPQFADQNVELIAAQTEPVWATVDHDRIAQVLTNLIGNALSYTPTGGVVTVSIGTENDAVQVTVNDTGRGLSDDQLSLVFERFYRADRSVPGGTGIGLTIARALARMHDGDVTVTSPGPGEGATFVLNLPTATRA